MFLSKFVASIMEACYASHNHKWWCLDVTYLTVAQKIAPMFACFWKIPLVWDADIIQSYIADSHLNYNILAWIWYLGHMIWIKAHEVLDQTKSLLIGAVFWVSIIFPEFCLLYSNRRQRNSHVNNKQCHVTLCVLIWPIENFSTASWHLTTYYYEIHFYCSTFCCHFSPQWGVFSSPNPGQDWSREGYCG